MQFVFALCFPFLTILVLGLDSVFFTENYFDAEPFANLFCILFFAGFYYTSKPYLRKLMLLMTGLSYIGELIFCTLLGMYEYRAASIPSYVPFGHAIVYASGYVYAHTEWAVKKELSLRKYFLSFFALLFLSVTLFLKDYLSLLFGILFFALLWRKNWQNLYSFIAFCVIFIELTGTYFKCWTWIPNIYGIPTSNPPMGAVFIYAGGDILLVKIAAVFKKLKRKKNEFYHSKIS